MQDQVFQRDELKTLARDMLVRGGLDGAMAEVVAELLVRTDEIGVTTHGISMVPYYLPELANGNMTASGSHEVVRDRPVSLVWDGRYLPGHWLMRQALDTCMARARAHGMCSLAMRRSHHIGCLSTLTRIAAEEGLVCLIATSDPWGRWVAPYGGTEPVVTPNPWAVGYPGDGHPVLIDTCASITTLSKVREHINTGKAFAHPWMLGADGRPTTDPTVINDTPKGSILPVGGADHGHKGYALALTVEMLTQALSGHGRAEGADRWGANVYLQVMEPDAFAGAEAFGREVGALNGLCRASRPAPGVDAVRVPGDRAYARLAESRARGVALPAEVWTRVTAAAQTLDLPVPAPLSS